MSDGIGIQKCKMTELPSFCSYVEAVAVGRGGGGGWRWSRRRSAVGQGGGGGRRWVEAVGGGRRWSRRSAVGRCGGDRRRWVEAVGGGSMRPAVGRRGGGGRRWVEAPGGGSKRPAVGRQGGGGRRWVEAAGGGSTRWQRSALFFRICFSPEVAAAAYFNVKHTERNQEESYSTTVQGVVDSLGVFTDICVGYPGSMSDDKILEKSALYQRLNTGNLKNIWVVGNSGYPLLDWLMVPYTHPNLTWTQHLFNEQMEEIQKIAKNAFVRLKGRWMCLQKQMEVKVEDLPVVIGACCVLHNICELRGEDMDADLRFDLFDNEIPAAENNGDKSVTAVHARDSIAHNLLFRRF
ncbi:hypothetical protein OSB04_026375 [Centaurea solstitialis]|uniref:DDE Tnp4 domain-containing protein n=1 Tax=Centaurea solstitialis TaxID=347529 RepID=A0AA38W766_9ASTR|nr:hypothetical protein OSB04_026375 [Centaurea solstitialis]